MEFRGYIKRGIRMNMEDKEFMEKYILNNPFDFKQGIISHCREMDKIDVYNWIAEDELKIDKLQQENKILRENAENNDKVVDKVNWKNQLLKKENKQLKDNWSKLKEDLINDINYWQEQEKEWIKLGFITFGGKANNKIIFKKVLDEMQELEGSDSNVKE